MPDYPGAKAAIRARLEANWSTTRITYQNETPAEPWPPMDVNAVLQSWVNLEIIGTGHWIVGIGVPGNRVWRYDGDILVHVFTPVGSGLDLGDKYANQIGEIFRAKQFYNEVPGFGVRTLAPSIDDGGSADDDGNWFRTTMTCEFTYWHRG